MGSILVSISCLTYNHGPYIRKCLEGFMMQKTNFKFEVLIHDDASTDGTEEIIREYESKYPEIIKPLYETENQWLLGRRGSKTFNYPRAKGKYIALCEGDDYWTDPLKLQKQVDFLEKNPDFSLCFHNALVIDGSNNKYLFNKTNSVLAGEITTKDIILKSWFTPTASFMFRNLKKITGHATKGANGDICLIFVASLNGKIFYDDNVQSVYRFQISKDSLSVQYSKFDLWKKKMAFYRLVDIETKNKYIAYSFFKRIKVTLGLLYFKLCGK